MKTIEEAALEYAIQRQVDAEELKYICRYQQSFKAGVEFAQKMVPINDEKPSYYTPVIVEYEQYHAIAWLAWSESHGDIWTIDGTDVILEFKPTHWRHINIK